MSELSKDARLASFARQDHIFAEEISRRGEEPMYGLMRAKSCGQPAEEKHRYRMHYCGTCKTMGRLYGQRARLLLNNDAVFLGELLTALSPEAEPVLAWDKSYQSYSCFAMPEGEAVMPLSLQVAATATLVMSEFKVTDQIADGSGKGWKMALRVYSQGFHEASERLKAWGFPIDTLWKTGRQQESREAESTERHTERTASEWLDYLAEPTAAVTGQVFQYGAATVGSTATEAMYSLGYAFGQLVYLLDAREDFYKDTRRKEFNALRVAFDIRGPELPLCYLTATDERIREAATKAEDALRSLPLAPELEGRLATRLHGNLERAIGDDSCETTAACATPRQKAGLRARWNAAVSLAKTLTGREQERAPGSLGKKIAAPFVFVSVLAIALIVPRFALAATSYRECLEFSLNLMALGAMAGALVAIPARLMQPVLRFAGGGGGSGSTAMPIQPGVPRSAQPKRRRPGWADGCNCGSANCWDCICCCQSIECCCDTASCCECCGSGACEGCSSCGGCG